jgi:hypothetical protein
MARGAVGFLSASARLQEKGFSSKVRRRWRDWCETVPYFDIFLDNQYHIIIIIISKSARALHREKQKLERLNESSVMIFLMCHHHWRLSHFLLFMINMFNPNKMSLRGFRCTKLKLVAYSIPQCTSTNLLWWFATSVAHLPLMLRNKSRWLEKR